MKWEDDQPDWVDMWELSSWNRNWLDQSRWLQSALPDCISGSHNTGHSIRKNFFPHKAGWKKTTSCLDTRMNQPKHCHKNWMAVVKRYHRLNHTSRNVAKKKMLTHWQIRKNQAEWFLKCCWYQTDTLRCRKNLVIYKSTGIRGYRQESRTTDVFEVCRRPIIHRKRWGRQLSKRSTWRRRIASLLGTYQRPKGHFSSDSNQAQ